MRLLRRLLVVAVTLTSVPAAIAETMVQDVTVTASIEAACTVFGDTLDFGIYDPDSGADRTATARIGLDCSAEDVPIIIRLDGGRHPNGGERRMEGGQGHFLRYNLYTEHSGIPWREVWGDGNGFGEPVETSFSSSFPYRTVHGHLPGGQQVAPGNYTDIVTITVTVSANTTQ